MDYKTKLKLRFLLIAVITFIGLFLLVYGVLKNKILFAVLSLAVSQIIAAIILWGKWFL